MTCVSPIRTRRRQRRRAVSVDTQIAVMAELFDMLSDPTRLRLLMQLRTDDACVSDLALLTGTSESAVSHALRLAASPRIVDAERRGRRIFYTLADENARVVIDATIAHLDAGRR